MENKFKHLKTFENHIDCIFNTPDVSDSLKSNYDVSDSLKTNEDNEFGIVNIHIDGQGFIKNRIIDDIRQVLSKYQGERYMFVDGKEVNPYRSNDRGF